MEATPELRSLADLPSSPCVTLYLNTWTKEPAARERAKQFLERRIGRALRLTEDPVLAADLERVRSAASAALAGGGPPALPVFAPGPETFRVPGLAGPGGGQPVVCRGSSLPPPPRLSGAHPP